MNADQRSPSRATRGGQASPGTAKQGASEIGISESKPGTFHVTGPSVLYVFGQPGTYTVNSNFSGNMSRTFSYNDPANNPRGNGNEVTRNQAARGPIPGASTTYSSHAQSASTSPSLPTLPSTSEEETSRYFRS